MYLHRSSRGHLLLEANSLSGSVQVQIRTRAAKSYKYRDIQTLLREVCGDDTRLTPHDQHLSVETGQGKFTGAVTSEYLADSFHVMDRGKDWDDQDSTRVPGHSWDARVWYADGGDEDDGTGWDEQTSMDTRLALDATTAPSI